MRGTYKHRQSMLAGAASGSVDAGTWPRLFTRTRYAGGAAVVGCLGPALWLN